MKLDVAIIGAGITGSALAYYLSKRGIKNIAVFEKQYVCSGSTGRCGGGIRQQWATPGNCRLAYRSVKHFEKLEQELGYPTEYYQGGYLLLAFTEEEKKQFEKNVLMQQKAGVPVRLISQSEIKKMFPYIKTDDVKIGTHCQTDGHANPMLVTQAYAEAAKKNGVKFHLFTEIKKIERRGEQITSISTETGDKFEVGVFFNAAGGYSADVAAMAGLEIPTRPQRHEILVTEPLKKFLDPLVISFHHHIYFRQTMHGSLVMGWGDDNEPYSHNTESSLEFLKVMSRQITKLVPAMKSVKIIRQWAGLYNMTPDAQPILGRMPGLSNYYQAVGYSGHGFMIAPAVTELMAELIDTGKTSIDISELTIDRFKGNQSFTLEKSVV
ncbi:MAG: FAD-binding oxidoreductase [Candidatus Wallbacteria bacterium]|nr:FAD-binding oxidoreductase [Candidatus Wallbacteria bacterium]